MTTTTAVRDLAWFAGQINKTPDWVRRHLDDIPHHRIGNSTGFTEQDLADYLEAVRVSPRRMQTTGPRRKSA